MIKWLVIQGMNILDVNASHVRINLSYNSKQMEGNLAEVELYGSKVGELNDKIEKIEVADFEDTKWAKAIVEAYRSKEFKEYLDKNNNGLWYVPSYN